MTAPFMDAIASGLGRAGVRVIRFEFPYMEAGRKVPDREPVLRASWLTMIERLGGGSHVFIGGKSMGGRIATMVGDEAGVRGIVCFGYPFHPPGNLEKLRTAHLKDLRSPALIVQGTRDTFGNRDEVETYELSPSIHIEWLEGDHSLLPKKGRGATKEGNLEAAVSMAAAFIRSGG